MEHDGRPAMDPKKQKPVSDGLMAHTIDTFGTRGGALQWLSLECGALANRTPLELMR